MSATLTAKEISEAWLAFVNETFMPGEGSSSGQEGDEMYRQLEESEQLQPARETWRTHTDKLIEEILGSAPESRREIISNMNPTAVALVHDRILCVTKLMAGFVQQDLKIKTDDGADLTEFFRQLLLQKDSG